MKMTMNGGTLRDKQAIARTFQYVAYITVTEEIVRVLLLSIADSKSYGQWYPLKDTGVALS